MHPARLTSIILFFNPLSTDRPQADFAAELESLSNGAIDQENVTLSRFTITAENSATMDMEIYFTDAEDAFAAKNLLTTAQIGLQFQELGAGRFYA